MEKSSSSPFLKGFMGGAFNGALMAGIFSSVWAVGSAIAAGAVPTTLAAVGALMPMTWFAVGVLVTAIGLFNGVMTARRAHEENNNARNIARDILREGEIRGVSRGVTPVLAPQADIAEDQQPQKSWTDRTGRSTDRIQAILDDGALSSKDRAAAILAERDGAGNLQR